LLQDVIAIDKMSQHFCEIDISQKVQNVIRS